MDFPKMLKRKQLELGMTITEFARHIGKSRQFLTYVYSKNENIKKYKLSELTMYMFETKFGIPINVMEEYNKYVEERNGRAN